MKRKLIGAALVTAIATTAVWAGGHGGNPAVKARQAHMQLYSFNLNILGGMAKGEVDYDAEAASAAAANLAAVSKLNQMAYWPPGTDSESVDGSRTLAKAWDNVPDLIEKGTALATAASAMEAAAGTDLASLQSAMGPLGGTCSACHKAYRVPRN